MCCVYKNQKDLISTQIKTAVKIVRFPTCCGVVLYDGDDLHFVSLAIEKKEKNRMSDSQSLIYLNVKEILRNKRVISR